MKRSERQRGDVVCDEPIVMRGHLSAEEVAEVLDMLGYTDPVCRRFRHTFARCTPAQPGSEYDYWVWCDRKPGERGAFPATVVLDRRNPWMHP